MFNNELEVLELRLHELYNYVDKFVLVESVENHRLGTPKPCYFELNQNRFKQFRDKIIYIKLEERIETDNGWLRENWQRNQIMRGLTKCKSEDLIFISDVDEFIPGNLIYRIYKQSNRTPIMGFWQKMYRWYLNRSTDQVWAGSAALKYKYLIRKSPQEIRELARGARIPMFRAGWHFTSMGGYERSREKYYDIVEGWDTFLTFDQWRSQVNEHRLVPIDSSYPKYIQNHISLLTSQNLIDSHK